MRIATFNVENLFNRPKALNFATWSEGQPAINAARELNILFNKPVYSAADQARMLVLLKQHGLLATRPHGTLLEFRKIRSNLFTVPTSGPARIVATGRADWIGWVDLKTEPITETALQNTAQVIADVDPDILVLVEVETRPSLQKFLDLVLKPLLPVARQNFAANMLIDGNDERGIDVAIVSRFPITDIRSHLTDEQDGKRIFSRDCPEYHLDVGGRSLVVLPNHFSSKGSDLRGARRRVQSGRVREIYDRLVADGKTVVVAGDLNDFPDSGALDALLKSELTDAMALPIYKGLPGTYQRATAKEKIDYLLLPPALTQKDRVTAVDVNRRGFYAPTKWKSYDNITAKTKDVNQASDHHCLWADVAW